MIKPINGWTKASILKHIEENFKERSFKADGEMCAYRGDDGNKCAVGVFIPDEEYCDDMDGTEDMDNTARGLLQRYPRLKPFMPLRVSGLCKLQQTHDHSHPTETKMDLIDWVTRNVKD